MSSIEKEIRLKVNESDIDRIKNITDSYKDKVRLIDSDFSKHSSLF